jgi:hypothetical protein
MKKYRSGVRDLTPPLGGAFLRFFGILGFFRILVDFWDTSGFLYFSRGFWDFRTALVDRSSESVVQSFLDK